MPLQLRCKNSPNLGLKASYYTNFERFILFIFEQSLFYYLKNISRIFQTFLYVHASTENMVLVLGDKFQHYYVAASLMHSKTLLWLLILFLNITINCSATESYERNMSFYWSIFQRMLNKSVHLFLPKIRFKKGCLFCLHYITLLS